ncbi:nuclear pore complex protein Nup107 [Leptopilina heterotoma]|uniref:nuclear pore complex protein Nup107 n=1 Tax=Leptopilina heterotoma TaxID=63436 RepID=UPI001CA847B6|nr:nuclear pore complex protein Nup107 [Leptopilina heterotoma]
MEDRRRSFLRLSHKSIIKNDSLRRNSMDFSYISRKNKENSEYDFDTSLTMAPHELRDIMANSEKTDITLREMMDDGSATGIILKSKEPWRDINSNLYYEFMESIQSHLSEPEVFNTIADFIQNCTDTLELMRGMQAKVESKELSNEEVNLENERNTWRLIYCLYQNRQNASFQKSMDIDMNSNISEKELINSLYDSDKLIREYQLIIDWLEKNALDQADKLPSIEQFTDKTVAWENTLHQLHNRQFGIMFASSRPIVSSLDPDAPVREGKPLHDLDREDDERLERRMFIEIRCGRLQRAQALAIHCGQPWRAACLLGWTPYHDPNYTNPLNDTKLPVEGNPNRGLWKRCAWELSEDKRVGRFYRALYASLCGNVQQLLPMAISWQDALWSHMKGLLDIKVEREVTGTMPKSYTTMPDDYWKGEVSLEDIFTELRASKDQKVRTEASKPDHLIQKYLILDQIPQLMEEIETMIHLGVCDSQLLRFLAHLVLFLRRIGKCSNDKIANKVLLAYVRVLIDIGDPILVAYYAATLPQEDQVTNYAHFLEDVKQYEQRKKCLVAAEEANLNVEAITKLVVENIRVKNVELESLDLKGEITAADLEKIDALDWVLFYPNQREEALWQSNALMRCFLSSEKIDAARKTFNKIPNDTIEVLMSGYPNLGDTIANLTMTNSLPKKPSSSIREYMCYKAYLDAQEGFSEWFSHYHHGKPIPLEDLPTYATFTEKVAHDHKKAQYNSELERWKSTMAHQTKEVKQLLFNVLLFPDGGWLVDAHNNENDPLSPEEILREHQMEKLRKLCIPKIALLLHTVMSEMNEHFECVQLADVLASEQYHLYNVFPREKLREIFKKICESSVALMDQKKDAWGYSK